MKRLLLTSLMIAILASCSAGSPDEAKVEKVASLPVVKPSESAGERADSEPRAPVRGAFQTSLPEGVILTQPHYASMDVSVPSASGTSGRRIQFDYLEGDAEQALRAFAASMVLAGFETGGPDVENGVVRQVFEKPGYGAVFARAEQPSISQETQEATRGFIVIAWPPSVGVQ